MAKDKVEQAVELPLAEAADLATRAAANGVSTPEYLGIHVLRSAYGALHPIVARFEARDVFGTERDGRKVIFLIFTNSNPNRIERGVCDA
ncbi:hypothetical protein ACVCIC_04780 [Burkholderia glumae]|uniref:Uncharacterized protein n=1 Tax=Burkholderia glumae TaxID=337 RepID=A0ABY5B9L2_BURGL|nr:hypothetical protein [Burkholderia glumae]MCM2483384.1 hypothetical protein [Burkholderia glumae]MCM2511286.1 hypothetical protein [Burkholderia glumae]MCM2541161.1 hypothetical protein [Burkholderia glumae]QJP68847.1 hypothetical protein HJC54_00215 [Burkholderia glumae]USS43712.1 hypothetical protein NFI99_04480 [Burkholderia glumae]